MSDSHFRIEVLRPKAGDAIVVSVPGPLSIQQRDCIQRACSASLPVGVKVMVLDSRVSFAHVVNPEPAPEPHPAEAIGFDAWMRARTEQAHREHNERTSRLPACAPRVYPPGQIAQFYGISHGGID